MPRKASGLLWNAAPPFSTGAELNGNCQFATHPVTGSASWLLGNEPTGLRAVAIGRISPEAMLFLEFINACSRRHDEEVRSEMTSLSLIVWDLEAVPDLKGFAAANNNVEVSDEFISDEISDNFPKLIFVREPQFPHGVAVA